MEVLFFLFGLGAILAVMIAVVVAGIWTSIVICAGGIRGFLAAAVAFWLLGDSWLAGAVLVPWVLTLVGRRAA